MIVIFTKKTVASKVPYNRLSKVSLCDLCLPDQKY